MVPMADAITSNESKDSNSTPFLSAVGPTLCTAESEYFDPDDIDPTFLETVKHAVAFIRGLCGKLTELNNLIADLHNQGIFVPCVLMCETFLNQYNVKFCNLNGYTLVHNNRTDARGGGVAIFVSDVLKYKMRDDLTRNMQNEFESIFVEISTTRMGKILVGEIYRAPNTNLGNAIDRYLDVIKKCSRGNPHVVIGTDQNVDLLKLTNHGRTWDFLNVFTSNGFAPCISKPTRITRNTATLIDNLYVKGCGHSQLPCILRSDISAHFPCMLFTENFSSCTKAPVIFKYRKYTTECISMIENDMLIRDWNVLHNMDMNCAYTYFSDTLVSLIEQHAPQKTITISHKNYRREPWFTRGLQKSSSKLKKMYALTLKRDCTSQTQQKYLSYRNMYNKIKKHAKTLHYKSLLAKYKNNIKKTWQTLNELIGNVKSHETVPTIMLMGWT